MAYKISKEGAMEINIDGTTLVLKGYIHLDEQMDKVFVDLLSKFFKNSGQPVETLFGKYPNDFDKEIIDFLFRKQTSPGQPIIFKQQDNLFTNFSIIHNNYLFNGLLDEAQKLWARVLLPVFEWEKQSGARVHKGSIYYFWGAIAIQKGEIDKGFFLIHSSVEEDIKTQNSKSPGTPAYKTVTLDFQDPNQYLFNFVTILSDFLNNFIGNYTNEFGNKFKIEDFKKFFLLNPPSIDVVFSFTHTLARMKLFSRVPPFAIQGNFAASYELNLLFDLVLVIDAKIFSSIPSPQKDDWKFSYLANLLLQKSGGDINPNNNKNKLSCINRHKEANFDKTLNDLIDQKFIYDDGSKASKLECQIGIAYCLRNRGAHKIESVPTILTRYSEIQQCLFNVLFLSIEHL
jgi:hypothetical protein